MKRSNTKVRVCIFDHAEPSHQPKVVIEVEGVTNLEAELEAVNRYSVNKDASNIVHIETEVICTLHDKVCIPADNEYYCPNCEDETQELIAQAEADNQAAVELEVKLQPLLSKLSLEDLHLLCDVIEEGQEDMLLHACAKRTHHFKPESEVEGE